MSVPIQFRWVHSHIKWHNWKKKDFNCFCVIFNRCCRFYVWMGYIAQCHKMLAIYYSWKWLVINKYGCTKVIEKFNHIKTDKIHLFFHQTIKHSLCVKNYQFTIWKTNILKFEFSTVKLCENKNKISTIKYRLAITKYITNEIELCGNESLILISWRHSKRPFNKSFFFIFFDRPINSKFMIL